VETGINRPALQNLIIITIIIIIIIITEMPTSYVQLKTMDLI